MYDLGAIDYISRPFDERTVKHRVASNYLLTVKQREMSDRFRQFFENDAVFPAVLRRLVAVLIELCGAFLRRKPAGEQIEYNHTCC